MRAMSETAREDSAAGVQEWRRDGKAPERDQVADREVARSVARARLLATLGASVVHDLANRVGVFLGFAEATAVQLPAGQATPLLRSAEAARDSLALLRSVARLLDVDPRGVERIGLRAVATEGVRLLRKHAEHGGATLAVRTGDEVFVRAEFADLLHALAAVLLFVAPRSAGELALDIVREPADRPRATVRIVARGPAGPFAALAAVLLGADEDGRGPASRRLEGGTAALVLAQATLRRFGGDVEVAHDGDLHIVRLWLPEAVRR